MNVSRPSLRVSALVAIAVVVVVAVAGGAPGQVVRPSPVAVLPTGAGSPTPVLSEAPTPTRSETPTPMPTPELTLHPDGMATVAAPGDLLVWSAPGGAKAKVLKPRLAAGAVVFLARGPRRVEGTDWWEIQVDYTPALPTLFGWVHATGPTGQPGFLPFAPACPVADAPLDSRFIKGIGTLRALACFGGRTLTVQGILSCVDAAVDSSVGGASWQPTNYSCSMEGDLWLDGPVVAGLLDGARGSVVGQFEVRGHFDDPEAAACSFIPFGTSLLIPSGHPDPGAVIACRQAFVVTAVTKLEQGTP